MKNSSLLVLILLLCNTLVFSGCVEETVNEPKAVDIDLAQVTLLLDDLNQSGFQKLNEEHVTETYVVSEGKLFEGLTVNEKIELYYINNTDFIIQQSAELQTDTDAQQFIDELKATSTFPGQIDDWNFTSISIQQIGNDSLLKQNTTELQGEKATINMLVFRVRNIVNIIVIGGSLPQKDIITYAKILEQRINDQISTQQSS